MAKGAELDCPKRNRSKDISYGSSDIVQAARR